jgi:hypothetical protein
MTTPIKRIYQKYIPEDVRTQIYRWRHRFQPKAEGWIDRINRQTREQFPELAMKIPFLKGDEKKKILMFSVLPWVQGSIEHILSNALHLRGHEVRSVVCSGLLPDCEMHYFDFERPPCELCLKGTLKLAHAFGIQPLFSTSYLDSEDVAETNQLLDNLDELEIFKFTYMKVPVGEIARFHLNVFYQTYLVRLESNQVEQMRRFAKSIVLQCKFITRILDAIQPDICITSNGKAFSYRAFFLLARQRGLRVVTWEEHAFDNTMKFVFSQNAFAGEIHLEEAWETECERQLTPSQREQLEEYFGNWRQARITPFEYHRNTRPEVEYLYNALGISKGSPIVACFPNMLRDTLAFDRDIGFATQLDWLISMVHYAEKRPELNLIVRAHPAERVLPEKYAKYNRFFVGDEIRRAFPTLPANVHLIEGDSPINTYTLIDEAQVICVYSSTVGLECALDGRLTCLLGDVHYRSKGFTQDIEKPEQLWSFLDNGPTYPRNISSEQQELAWRYAYLWRFRHPTVMPFYSDEYRRFDFPDLSVFTPNINPTIDTLCRRILDGRPFIDIPA